MVFWSLSRLTQTGNLTTLIHCNPPFEATHLLLMTQHDSALRSEISMLEFRLKLLQTDSVNWNNRILELTNQVILLQNRLSDAQETANRLPLVV